MQSTSRKIFTIMFAILLFAVPLFVFEKLDTTQIIGKAEYKGVLTLWHVDMFEGGSGSRGEFLKGRAIEFEKVHKGVLVSVQVYTYEQVEQKLKNGDKFDLISFSPGMGEAVKGLLGSFSGKVNVRDDLLDGGKIGNTIKALPWAVGGYMVCAFDSNLEMAKKTLEIENIFDSNFTKKVGKSEINIMSFGVGFSAFSNPLCAIALNGAGNTKNEKAWNKNQSLTGYEAYQNFLNKNKFCVLLGTQRDVSRLSLRASQGKLDSVTVKFLSGFTDMVQYIGYCDNGSNRGEFAQRFMEYITNDVSQRRLSKIELYSATTLTIYSSGLHADMEKALQKKLVTPSVFTDVALLARQKNDSFEKLFG